MELEENTEQKVDIFQQAIGLAKENHRLAQEKEEAEERVASQAKFPSENPNPVLRIGNDKCLLYANAPALSLLNNKLLNGETAKTGDQVPFEFQKMASHAFSSQSIQQSEIKVGMQTFHLQWAPILSEGYVNVYGRDITKRKKTEQALKESETRAQEVLNHAACGIITIDEQGVIESFNPAAEKLFGYKASEKLGTNIKFLMPEPYQSEHDQYMKNYLETGISKIIGIRREAIGLRGDGTTFPLDLGVSEMYQGETRKFTGIVRDISELKQAEAKNLLQYELTRIFLAGNSLDDTFPKILQTVGEFMEWEISHYWEKNPESEELNCRYSWNADCLNENDALNEFKKISFNKAFKKGKGLPGRVWEELEPFWIPDVRTDKNFPRAPFAKSLGMKAGFGFPVFSKNQFLGVIEVFTRQLCLPDTQHIQLMTSLGGQIGQWMHLKKAEEQLEKLNLKTLD